VAARKDPELPIVVVVASCRVRAVAIRLLKPFGTGDPQDGLMDPVETRGRYLRLHLNDIQLCRLV